MFYTDIWLCGMDHIEMGSSQRIHVYKDYSGYGLRQWGTVLECHVVSHWLSPYLEWSLVYIDAVYPMKYTHFSPFVMSWVFFNYFNKYTISGLHNGALVCPIVSEASRQNMGKCVTPIHYEL